MAKASIMGVFAHPDDESFGPGGTLAKYAQQGHTVHILTATRGQAGQTSDKQIKQELGHQRVEELKTAAKIIKAEPPLVLRFFDGSLNEQQLPLLKELIEDQIDRINPDIVITFELLGISRHLDHIAVNKAVTQLYDEDKINPKKLYYFGLSKAFMQFFGFEGGLEEAQLTQIDISSTWETKLRAMKAHQSQEADWRRIIKRFKDYRKQDKDNWQIESFQLARTSLSGLKLPETDLLQGLV